MAVTPTTSHKRLLAEARDLRNKPSSQFAAAPVGEDLFHWHFTIRGPPGTPFEGGLYHGRIILPPNYPYKPPHIIFLTPSGRFEINKKICLSISAYHPESWQPSWTLRLMLKAIISFMPTPGEGAIAAIDAPDSVRQEYARRSQTWRCPHCGDIHKLIPSAESIGLDQADSASEIPRGLVFGAPSAAAKAEAKAKAEPEAEPAAAAVEDDEGEDEGEDSDDIGGARSRKRGSEETDDDDDDDEDDDGINDGDSLPALPTATAKMTRTATTPPPTVAAAPSSTAVSGAERVLAAAAKAEAAKRSATGAGSVSAGRRKTDRDTRTTAELVAELARLEARAAELRAMGRRPGRRPASTAATSPEAESGSVDRDDQQEHEGEDEEHQQAETGAAGARLRRRTRTRRRNRAERGAEAVAQRQPFGDDFLNGLAVGLAVLIVVLLLRRVIMGPWRPLAFDSESFE